MSALPKTFMTVDEFLVWAEGRPGRYELEAGEIVAMSPERARHAEVKGAAFLALRDAIKRAGAPCRVMPDGMTVRINSTTAYEPDALVYCGPRLGGDDIEVRNPCVIVEIASPGTRSVDQGVKLIGYFRVPSIMHYLLVDPLRRVVVHHARGEGDMIATRIVGEGILTLSPPGFDVDVGEFFADA